MIRAATPADIPAIVEMGRAFFAESGFGAYTDYDPESFADSARRIINGEVAGSFLIADGGMAAAIYYSLYLNKAQKTAQELFWYAVPEKRNGLGRELLGRLEADAKASGIDLFIAASTAGLRDDALNRVYRMRGFAPCEHTYIKRL